MARSWSIPQGTGSANNGKSRLNQLGALMCWNHKATFSSAWIFSGLRSGRRACRRSRAARSASSSGDPPAHSSPRSGQPVRQRRPGSRPRPSCSSAAAAGNRPHREETALAVLGVGGHAREALHQPDVDQKRPEAHAAGCQRPPRATGNVTTSPTSSSRQGQVVSLSLAHASVQGPVGTRRPVRGPHRFSSSMREWPSSGSRAA